MLNTPPPNAAMSGFPRTGEQVPDINAQQTQAFTVPGIQSQTLMKRGMSPLATSPVTQMPVEPQNMMAQPNPAMGQQGMMPQGHTGSVDMASALMNPYRM